MKQYLIPFFFIFINIPLLALHPDPYFSLQKNTLPSLKQSEKANLYFFTRSQISHYFSDKTLTPYWIETDVVGHFETPLFHPSFSFHLQSSLGSQGFLIHSIWQWVPFPDFGYQPTIGLLFDISTGLSSTKQFVLSSYLQLLLKKTFPINHKSIQNITPYLTPLIQYQHKICKTLKPTPLTQCDNFFALSLITGFSIQYSSQNFFSSPLFFGFEGNYSHPSIFSIRSYLLWPF